MRSEFAKRAFRQRQARRRGRRVSLELQTEATGSTSANSFGHSQKAFGTRSPVNAFVRQLSGEEVVFARELVPRATHQVEIDYVANCTPRSRFKYPGESRVLNIEAVDNFEQRNRILICLCHEEVST